MLFVAHHHSIEEITLIANRYEKMLLNFHDSISLNGNACRMFEFLGKRSRMALTGGAFGAEQGLAS